MDIDNVIEKIKKALRLANKTTSDGERETAMRLAQNLADKNGLSISDININEVREKALMVNDEKKQVLSGPEIGFACFILREHFGVVAMINKYGNGKSSITWFGCSINIDIARYVFNIVIRESRKAWDKERCKIVSAITNLRNSANTYNNLPVKVTIKRLHRENFMRGFFFAIHEKLTQNPLRNDTDNMKREKEAAEKKFSEFSQKNDVKEQQNKRSKFDAKSFLAGVATGAKVSLSRPCEGRMDKRMQIGCY